MVEQFALKLADLWRYESGLPIDHLFGEWTGWEHFEKAQAQKRGVLLLTPHLGNWEFGGPLLTQRGVNLQVITLAEPGNGFTELRQASRARWDIDTLVIGEDPFAFVEIIRRLEAGATVALLVDRPPAASSVMVELFGRPICRLHRRRRTRARLRLCVVARLSTANQPWLRGPYPADHSL